MDVKISVIIPVYNVNGYLQRCLQSLEEQTVFDELEIVLVDDGSTDGSAELCDDFAARHPENVRLLHKQNGGVSTARNVGIDMATGNYYLFLDSDDFLRSDACELLSKTAAESGADLVTFKETMVYDDKVRVLPAGTRPAASWATRRPSTRWRAARAAWWRWSATSWCAPRSLRACAFPWASSAKIRSSAPHWPPAPNWW